MTRQSKPTSLYDLSIFLFLSLSGWTGKVNEVFGLGEDKTDQERIKVVSST